jgi:hypothetical protein
VNLYEIWSGRIGNEADFIFEFLRFFLPIIISPLFHAHVSSLVLLRFAVALARQHIITSLGFNLGVQFLKLHFAGCEVSSMEAGRRGLEILSQNLHEGFEGNRDEPQSA